ncbi:MULTISPECIES: hypothetical protein [unclassified Streptomyces]|uniref:hypothetical protein n=1 Tax=unclassified Streptomyces TaxID=2593676 RepID=UPI000691C87F|nr:MULTISPECIES: hypothetical protein [unclassified Streptomyces]
MNTPRIFGREPSAILGLVAVAVQFFSAFVMEVSQDTQTAVNAVAAAAVGLAVAWIVRDGVIAAVTGLAAAALALGMNLGLDWSADRQAAWMAAVMVAAQWFVRTQVTAPAPPNPAKAAVAAP